MSIAVSGAQPLREITEIAKKRIKEPLETIKGVGKISMVGGLEPGGPRRRQPDYLSPPSSCRSSRSREALQQQNIEVPRAVAWSRAGANSCCAHDGADRVPGKFPSGSSSPT
ncbi:MAG: hypothetical protein IPI26_08995 [Elusimicrobia bacterium]|nr:hypothetical protein [Elusimicrobiota bacterium]